MKSNPCMNANSNSFLRFLSDVNVTDRRAFGLIEPLVVIAIDATLTGFPIDKLLA